MRPRLIQKVKYTFRRMQPISYLVLLLLMVLSLACCNAYHTVTVNERNSIEDPQRIYRVELKDGSFVDFSTDSLRYGRLRESEIFGVIDDGSTQSIPLSEISRIYTKGPSTAATIGNITIVLASVAAIVLGFSAGLSSGLWGP